MMGIPASNILTLFFNGTVNNLIVTSGSDGTAFRMDANDGLIFPESASISGLGLTTGALSLNFTAPFSGQVSVGLTVGVGSFLLVGGSFSPGTVQASWIGQSGGYEPLSSGAKLPID